MGSTRVSQAKDLLDGFTEYYRTGEKSRVYSRKMAEDIVDQYSWISPEYKVALYKEVIREFTPTAMRPLPDIAALTRAEKQLPHPEVLRDRTKELPPPAPSVNERGDVTGALSAVKITQEALWEARMKERNRIRERIKKSPTLYKMWWLETWETHGEYRKMPDDYAARHPGIPRWGK